ncbi:MAG: hypothetical protein IJI67_08905 [Clostridia bacterium]|nr:hypothetical protein [Clostridia bacterium]
MKKKIFATILAFVLVSTLLPLSVFAAQKTKTHLECTYLDGFEYNEDGTTVFSFEDDAIQSSFVLYDENDNYVDAALSEVSAVIVEAPAMVPYRLIHTISGVFSRFTVNFYLPENPGDYTLRFSYSGTGAYEGCVIDVPFRVVAQKQQMNLQLNVADTVGAATGAISGTLTDTGSGAAIGGKFVKLSFESNKRIFLESCTTDAGGNFSVALPEKLIEHMESIYALNPGRAILICDADVPGDNTYAPARCFEAAQWVKSYTLVWLDSADNELDTAACLDGDTAPQTDKIPQKAADETYSYTFKSWDEGTLSADNATITYRPIFTSTAHNPAAPVVENNTDPTCTGGGYYESVVYCSDCSYEISRTPVNVPASGHDFSGAWVTDETNHWHKCSRCEVIDSKAQHTWNEGTVTTAPTATAQGEKEFTCTVCSATKTEVLPAVPEYTVADTGALDWNPASGADLSLTIHRSLEDERTYDNFEGIELDGVPLSAEDYDIAAGSLVLTLKEAFLNTLAAGEHSLNVRFSDGAAQASVRVLAQEVPADPEADEEAQAPEQSATDVTATDTATDATATGTDAATAQQTTAPAATTTTAGQHSSTAPATGDSTAAVFCAIAFAATAAAVITIKRKKEDN